MQRVINMTSYGYLGLVRHPAVIAAAKQALDDYGTGACGSPILSGKSVLHQRARTKDRRFDGISVGADLQQRVWRRARIGSRLDAQGRCRRRRRARAHLHGRRLEDRGRENRVLRAQRRALARSRCCRRRAGHPPADFRRRAVLDGRRHGRSARTARRRREPWRRDVRGRGAFDPVLRRKRRRGGRTLWRARAGRRPVRHAVEGILLRRRVCRRIQ